MPMRSASPCARDADEVRDLLLHGLLLLVVVQVPGVVAELVDEGRHLLGEPVVLLQVDRQDALRLCADLRQRIDIGLTVDRDADHVRSRFLEDAHLPQGGGDVAGLGGRHGLDGDGGRAADLQVADLDGAGLARGDHRWGAPEGRDILVQGSGGPRATRSWAWTPERAQDPVVKPRLRISGHFPAPGALQPADSGRGEAHTRV